MKFHNKNTRYKIVINRTTSVFFFRITISPCLEKAESPRWPVAALVKCLGQVNDPFAGKGPKVLDGQLNVWAAIFRPWSK